MSVSSWCSNALWNQRYLTRVFLCLLSLGIIYLLIKELDGIGEATGQVTPPPEEDRNEYLELEAVEMSEEQKEMEWAKSKAKDLYWPRRKQIQGNEKK